MFPNSPVFPPVSSTLASKVDAIFFFTVGVSVLFTVLIVGTIVVFLVKYRAAPRRRRRAGRSRETRCSSSSPGRCIPLVLVLTSFFWGASIFFDTSRPPADAWSFHVYGKQWMWKVEHPEGKREINEFHVPVNQAVKLTMTSEDVIHDFSVPAFRLKMDVLPGPLHDGLVQGDEDGHLPHLLRPVLRRRPLARWSGRCTSWSRRTTGSGSSAEPPPGGTVATGEELFVAKACNTCHRPDSSARAPILEGIFGKPVDPRRRPDRRRRRELRPRVDPEPGREGRAGVPADHADLQGPDLRGGDRPAHQVHQGPEARRGRRRRGGRPAAGGKS